MERRQTRADTVDEDEVARFSRLSGEWWDARGPMAALHKFNPVRLAYIRDRVTGHFRRDATRLDSLAGLRILDIGCGGGILAEALAAANETFDVVLAMEVVEHVTDLDLFIDAAAALVKSGGLLFVATLNRTIKSFALAIVGAEYILRWLPRGTHQWDKFVTPNELEIAIEQSGLHITGETGVIYNLLAGRWQLSSDMDVNYMVVAERPA